MEVKNREIKPKEEYINVHTLENILNKAFNGKFISSEDSTISAFKDLRTIKAARKVTQYLSVELIDTLDIYLSLYCHIL
jgi:hypothetical protein